MINVTPWFILFTCLYLIIQLNSVVTIHNSSYYSYTYTTYIPPVISSNNDIQLKCPLIHAKNGDLLIIYKSNLSIYQVDLNEINLKVNYLINFNDTTDTTDNNDDDYWCKLYRIINNESLLVTEIQLLFTSNTTYETFIYDRKETQIIEGVLGENLTLTCSNPTTSQVNWTNQSIVWYRLPGLKINGQTSPELCIDKLTNDDLGTYFCSEYSMSLHRHLPVRKIEIWSNNFMSEINLGELIHDENLIYFQCPNVLNEYTFVIWEYPKGHIIVNEYNYQLKPVVPQLHHTKQILPICQYSWMNEWNTTIDQETYLRRVRRSSESTPYITISRRIDPDDPTVILQCHMPPNEAQTASFNYQWSTIESGKIGDSETIVRQIIVDHVPDDGVKRDTSITCEVTSSETGEVIGSITLDLEPKSLSTTGKMELSETTTEIFSYRNGDTLELHCELEKDFIGTGENVIWTFNGGTLPTGANRLDKLKTSIIVIKEMGNIHEGLYECQQNSKKLRGHILRAPTIVTLTVLPKEDERWANANDITEFHCRLDGRENGNQLIDWYFIPAGSDDDREIPLHNDVKIDNPDTTPSTSFLSIMNVQKYHEGFYVCRALNLKDTAKLIVKIRDLTVTPEEVKARPGTTVQFLCELSTITGMKGGKVFWMRTDRQDLRSGKEEVIGTNGGRALLIVKDVGRFDHNISYMCTDGYSKGYAKLYVQEVCAPGFRPCGSQQCLEETKFCDGVVDCEDGYDEIPSKCTECGVNENACGLMNDVKPLKNCYLQFWHCDGEDDCGNNFDESNCLAPSDYDQCNGTHYTCPQGDKMIARAFMCDSVPDCEPNGDDESECSYPSIIEPSGETHLIGHQSGNLTLTCVAYGRPPPTISWRYNWGHLREGVKHSINYTVINCNMAISHLTLTDLEPRASGLYTCEAVNRGRALAPDFLVNVAKGGICKAPQFNDAAWFDDMCLTCYCSNVTDTCTSVKGYRKSPHDLLLDFKTTPIILSTYNQDGSIEEGQGITEIDGDILRIPDVPNESTFIESDFNLSGSWVKSYGYDIIINLRLFGESLNYLPGPFVILNSTDQSIYWCPPNDRLLVHTIPTGYDNRIHIRLSERDKWFIDKECKQKIDQTIGRAGFMQIISDIKKIGFRVKYFRDQTTLELFNIKVEHAVKSDVPGQWVGEIEECTCPNGYEGLSCEKCAPGYQKDPDNPLKCRPFCACDKCDTEGNCIECPGKRAGPRCQQCQDGYYRPDKSLLATDCQPCDMCGNNLPYVVKKCHFNPQADDDYFCKCRISEDNKLLNPTCDRCQLAIDRGDELPDDAKCDTKPQPMDCHYYGTQLTSDNGDCQCKTGYTGVKCDECEEGYFNYMGQCLQCYCSGKTSSCRLSDEYYFWNITTEDSAGFGFDIWLGQRTEMGGLQRKDYTTNGNQRIEREMDNFYVKYPLNNKGIIHFGINLIPPKPTTLTQNDVTIYKYIYGGKMSFKIDSIKLNPNELTQREASVIVELESPRYGRAWTLATFNLMTQRYEVEFHENWWLGGWRLGTPLTSFDSPVSLTRNQLLRFLITTTNIGIITSSGNSESLNNMKLSGLSIQIGLPIKTNERQAFAKEQGLPKAPVEICDCPNPAKSNERELSPSCEGCTDLSKQTIIRLEPLGEDVGCGGCLGDKCDECSEGEYIYDIYTGKRLDSCQKAVTIDTKSRRIIVKLREPINLLCKATSYRGGLVTHEWITPNNEYSSQPIISRQYLAKPDYYNRVNLTTYQSETILQIKFAKQEDAGEYTCIAKGIGSEVNETFYVVVIDPNAVSLPDVPEDDEINRKFPLPIPPIHDPPSLTVYEIKKDPDNSQITLIGGQVKPEILDTHHTIWYSINGTPIDAKTEITDTARGAFIVRLPIPYETIKSGNDSITGYFLGKDPVYTPQWTRMMEPVIIATEADEITPDDIINPPAEVTVPFMQPYIVQVRTKPGKEDISVTWKKIGPLPETITEKKDDDVKTLDSDSTLPEGTSQDKTNLNIWAAAEQHEGIYEGTVVRDRDGVEVKRIQTIIRVQPMTSGSKTELGLAEAAEPIESEVGDDDDQEEKEPPAWDFIVGGFTPDAKHCENPTWTIVDYQLNKTTDITDKVIRTSDENFRVNYPLTSGLYLRFQCKPIPKSNLTGEIKFNISSPDPRIILKPIYDNPDSTFPTRLVCMDLNPEYDSSVNLTSSSMSQEMISHAITSTEQKFIIRKGDIPPIRRLEMDWRRIGEFDPFNNDGYFTCFVNNTETNGSKTIKLPSDKVPIQLPEDPFTRLYIYSPDTYVVPELDGSAKIMIPEGEQLRIYCVFEARPSNEFHGWRGTTSEIENNIKIEHRIYSSLAQTDKANLSLDGQKLECVYGERSKPLEISVIPKDERKLHAKILSDAFINDRLVGITGSDMNLTCDVKHTTRKPATIDKIDWYVQYPNGIRRDIKHTQLADSLSTGPKGEWIYFTKLTEKPQGLNIFCVVRLEDIQKATQAYYSSPHISLWIREPKVLVSIEGQDHLGIITGIETQTAQIKCIVKDAWRNKTVEEADIAWETKITSIQEELSNNNNERARPQPSPKDLPMLGAKALYDTMVIAGLRRQPNWIARFRCKGTDLKTGAYGYSDFVKLEVLPGDTLEQVPKLRLISHTDPNSPYPNKVECIDDNQNYESQVTWTRQDEPIDPAQITTTPNNAVLKWTHNGMDKFDPRIDAGIYTCRSVNPYSSSVKQVYIPYDLMVTDYETPITPEVRILSNVNEIFQDSGDRYVRVIQGQPFELICTFYGHPPPEGGLQWSIDRFNGTRNSLSSHWLSMQGLVIQSGRHYWTTIGSPQFDALGRHTGVFQCTALNSIGQIIERDQVRVELHKVYVRINELSESGLIENQKGSNGTITCNAYDGYLQFILPDATYTWEVERINGERVHPNLIADQIEMNHNQLHYYGLSPTANKLRIRCIALNDTARYISSDFSFRVFGSDKGEPMKISDIEPGGTKWISGGGEERITLKIGGKNDLTNHVTIKDGENVQLNCTAYDTVTGKVLTDGNLHFGWRLLGVYGETVPEAGLTRQSVQSYTIDDGNTGVLIIEDARPSSNLPQPSARIQCLATSYNDGVTYYSTLVDLIVYPEEIPVDHVKDVKDREKLNRLSVSVIGLDDRGRLSGTEGSSVKLECIATDRSTKQRTKESVLYGWEFSRLDGTPVDTTSLIGVGDSRLEVNENHLILQGLKQTTSILGRCRVIVPLEESHDEDAQLSRTEEIFYSPHFRFDIIDSDGTGRRDFIAPIQPIIPTKDSDIFIKVDGLDENGALSANKGDSVELKCIAMNQTTNEPLTDETTTDIEINYGIEMIRLNGLPASTLELTKTIDLDPKTGLIKLNELRNQFNDKDVRNRIQTRCIAEINYKSDKYLDQGIQRYASPYFLVNVPKDIEAIPDYIDVTHSRYEVTVGGLNNQGVLKVQPGQNIQLKCIIRDKETDTLMDTLTQNQYIGWQFPSLPSGHQVNMGDFAKRSKIQNDELYLEGIRNDYPDNLQGRCWFDDGFMHYYSPIFPIVSPSSVTDGRVRVEVQEIGTGDQKEYSCTAYDSRTGKRLSNVTYDWKFTTPNGETIPTVYYFNSIESYENKLKLGLLTTHLKLPEHLQSIKRIEGRCIILAKEYMDTIPSDDDKEKPSKMSIYESRPFVIINPLAIDSNELLTSPDSFPKSHRLYASVDGVKDGAVISPVGSTVTLTCQVYDSINQTQVENLNYNWEIKRRDGTPIDTSVLAKDYINVKGSGGNTLIIGNLRLLSAGLIGRCIVSNDSAIDSTITDIGLLGPNEKIYSPSFDFIITGETPTGSTDDVVYGGNKDYEIDGKDYEVVIEGLDEDGRLKVSKNDNKTLTVFLKHKETGEQIYPSPPNTCAGVETRYINGYPMPLSYLADTYEFQSDNGKFHLYNMKEPNISPAIQMRFIIEQKKLDEDGKLKDVIRYASQYIDLLPEKEDLPEKLPKKIYPIIDGLNNCGRLPLTIGNNITLICRPNDTRLLSESLLYDWEIRDMYGHILPRINLLAKAIKQENNRLILIGLMEPTIKSYGRCIIMRKSGIQDRYSSEYFEIGEHGSGCEPSGSQIITEIPGYIPKPNERYEVLIRIVGLNQMGEVIAKPGDDISLKCLALNSSTEEPIPNVSTGWSFMNDYEETIPIGKLASIVKLNHDDELQLTNLYENPNSRGRCMITLDQKVTLSSPYFKFHVPGETISSQIPISPSYSDKRVRVEISGLNEQNQISVTRVGDDATLRCQAIIVDTSSPLYPIHGVRYGWEWRYTDEDPVSTSNIAVSLETNGDRLGLRGIRPPPGTKGRNVKGRCIVHVPAQQIDTSLSISDELVYGSDYFSIDVARKPTTIDPQLIPIPGRDSDNIEIAIDGLDNEGYLVGNEKESASVVCEARNRTTNQRLPTEGLRAEYDVIYGWEFSDSTGRSVDSSLFADSVSMDSSGNLRLRDLVAPNRGNLPFKIRCTAVVNKRPSIPDEKPTTPKLYTSDYFGVDVRRSDGTSTRTGEEVDIKGSLIKVKIDGLKPDGTFATQLGENASIMCTAVDSNTDETIQDVIIGWDIRRTNGALINLGILADQVIQESNKLEFYSMKSLNSFADDIHGRCLVYRGNQIYRSDYFKIKVSTLPKEVDIEGDGRILVRLVDISPMDRKILLKSGESETIRCIGIDARTGDRVDYLNYGWDYYYTQSDTSSSPPIRGSLGPLVSKLEESPGGYLSILLNDDLTPKDEAYVRCRLSNGTSIYSSPYYRLVTESDEEGSEVIPVITPRYLITVHGLDKDGQLQIKQGDNVSLECSAIDIITRKPAEDVIYVWDFKEPGAYHPKGDFQFVQNQLTITNFDSLSDNVKGRCKVSYRGSNKWDSSPDFLINLEKDTAEPETKPPTLDDVEKLKEYEEAIKQKGIKEAEDTDDRILVTVDGLNDDGNLIGAANDDKTLDCNAEAKDGINSVILSYNWDIMDSNGNPISLNYLADNVILSSNDGVLHLNGLRISTLSEQGNLKGRCIVHTNITQTMVMSDGIEKEKIEQLLYHSKMFGIAITEDGTYTGPIGGLDLHSNKVRVGVIGLSSSGELIAESGDKVNLQCYAVDAQSNAPLSNAIYAWEIRDRHNQLVITETIAKIVLRSMNVISFIHLRPTDHLHWNKHLFGRCSAYSPETKHLYYSNDFHINVRQPVMDGKTGPDNQVHVEVTGIPPNGVLSAEEGDNVNLECRAVNTTDNTPITSDEATYHFQFDEAAPDRDDTYGGYLADEIIQEQLTSETDGIKLTLNGLKYGKWHRGRCVVQLLQKDSDKELKEPVKRYTSKYFWSDIRHKDEIQLEGIDPRKQITTIQGITYDPNILVKVYGTNSNDTITVKPGDNVELDCYALESLTGEPIKGMNYAWELRTYDNQPIHTNRLANQFIIGNNLSDNGQKLQLKGYQSTGEGIRLRCLAKGTNRVENKIREYQTYASPVYTFETIKQLDDAEKKPDSERKRYEPSQLHPEVIGLNADGTLTAKEGEDVKLQCQVVDSSNGIPIKDESFNVGWTIATGPDGQPIPFNNLAKTIHINKDELNLNDLTSTTPKSGGLRGYCSLYLNEENLISPEKYENHTVILNSDVFVIHVSSKQPDSQVIDSDSEDEKTPYRQWIPGKDPKNAVIVKVYELRPDGSVIVPPGGNLKLNCLALDAVRLRRLTSTDQIPPLFTWELRSTIGGQLLPYTEQSSGSIIIKQPSKDPKTAEEVGVSTIELQTMRLPVDAPTGAWGRCVVQIGHQVFDSPYFHIQLQKEATMETYSPLPKSYWSDDKSIELIVKGLDAEGNKIVQEGSDVELTCEARNTETQEILKNDQILIGWQFIDPEKHAYLIPWSSNAQISGNTLILKEIEIPGEQDLRWNAWGHCIGDIKDGDRIKHYQSEPFNLGVISEEISSITTDTSLVRKDGVYVKVQGISDDGLFTTTEGSDTELTCHAIDPNTGQPYISNKVTYGWDWRQMDGESADISEIGDIIRNDGNQMKISNIKYNTPKKGRCLVTIWPKEDHLLNESPQTYSSDLFFTNIQPLSTVQSLKPEDILPVDGTDDKVIIDISPMDNDKQQISLTINDAKTDEIRAVAKLASTDSPLDDTTNPQLIRYSYDLAYISGLPAHNGELGESFTFNSKEGSLIITNPHYTTKPLKIRFNAIVKEMDESSNKEEEEEQEQGEVDISGKKSSPLKRYQSDYYPIMIVPADESDKPIWSKHPVPVYDISGRSIKVQIDGLDNNGNAAGIPGEDLKLTCLVLDNFDLEVDLKSSSYTWQFIDHLSNPINPSRIGEYVEIQGRHLNIKGLRKSIIQDHIRGRCIIVVSVPIPVDIELRDDLPPIQEYGSSYFKFTTKITDDQIIKGEEETAVTVVTESVEETTTSVKEVEEEEGEQITESVQDRNFQLKIDSSTNTIYPMDKTKYTILARIQRALDLNCQAVFTDNPPVNNNDQFPKLIWYYRQPEIPGDVPIPSQLLPISPPRMETLSILPQTDYKIAISSDAYTFRDDNAEFQCQAFMNDDDNEPVAKVTIFIQKIREMFNVRIFDEESRSKLYVFTGTSKTLTCYVDDLITGERVEPSNYQWEMNLGDGNNIWIRETDPRQGAEDITGWRTNQLQLNKLRLPSTTLSDESIYEVRCVASYNDTYNTSSHPFIINVRNKPMIKSIRIDRVKPDESILEPADLPKDSYDSTQDYELGCKPEVTSGEAVATWFKCQNDDCSSLKEIVLTGDRLFYFANSTRYIDEGRFRCQVSLQLKEYNFKLIEHQDVIIKRQAAPAIYSSGSITYTTNDEMSLQCTDESSSPESKVDWIFEPSGKMPPERRLPKLIGNTYAYGRIYIFAIARGQLIPEHSGKYTCIATNPYGTANSSITVTVTEDLSRGKLRFVRRIIRRAFSG
ncbi:unnamed protein product [Schistosoma rodhaini]|nr:unnamed protein product [Schistosoma rodhaini]